MSDLRQIYQEVILDHYRKPRNFAEMEGPSHQADGHNPLCGDRVKVFLEVEGDIIRRISFQGAGCAISTASASLMTEAVEGKSLAEVEDLFQHFHGMVTTTEGEPHESLGKLEALSGVRQLPVRIKCATLAWHTLQAALKTPSGGDTATASTE
jgi:nitrogen fixation NifU-like protein